MRRYEAASALLWHQDATDGFWSGHGGVFPDDLGHGALDDVLVDHAGGGHGGFNYFSLDNVGEIAVLRFLLGFLLRFGGKEFGRYWVGEQQYAE